MNDWINERTNEWFNWWMDGRTDEWMDGWMDEEWLNWQWHPAGYREQIQVVARRGVESLNPEPPDYKTRTGLFKAELRKPRVTAKCEFRYESLKSKLSLIIFVYNLTIGCSKTNRENYRRKCFWTKNKTKQKTNTGLKFNPGFALIGLRTTGSCALNRSAKLSPVLPFVTLSYFTSFSWARQYEKLERINP